MSFTVKFWLRISLINLCFVAALGVLMRYKIGFEFPFFDQKSLQHSHSHFAFAGWVSQTLMVLMVHFLQKKNSDFEARKYNKILFGNLFSSYGMMISFIIQCYGPVSIFFSVASIVFSYWFGYQYWKDGNKIDPNSLSQRWFKAAVVFNVLSSVGTFVLAYMMATKTINEAVYLSSIYFYLHFQYNGWFFFACMGLLFGLLKLNTADHPFYINCFRLMAVSCVPAYFLSTLWLELPLWLYIVTIIAALVQFLTWIKFAAVVWKEQSMAIRSFPPMLQNILLFVAFALTVKLALQLASVIPAISKLAFGFRPIVIAYLHLVLLAIISLFLLFYIYATKAIALSSPIKKGLLIFAVAVLLNEIVLGLQGIGALSYVVIPYANEMLFCVSLLLFTGIGTVAYYSVQSEKESIV